MASKPSNIEKIFTHMSEASLSTYFSETTRQINCTASACQDTEMLSFLRSVFTNKICQDEDFFHKKERLDIDFKKTYSGCSLLCASSSKIVEVIRTQVSYLEN